MIAQSIIPSQLTKLSTILKNTDLVVAGICLVLLSSLTLISVFTRYIFNMPFMFLEEVQKALLLWITMCSGCACFRYKSHVMIEIIVDQLSKSKQRFCQYFICIIVAIVLIFMCIQGLRMCFMLYSANRVTNVLAFLMWIIYAIIPICSIAMIYQCLRAEIFNKSVKEPSPFDDEEK